MTEPAPAMRITQETIHVATRGQGLVDISDEIRAVAQRSGVTTGLCVVFVQHTSASLLIQENADPAVRRDLEGFAARLAPESFPWEHADEGPDDMPAHVRSAVTRTSETIPITRGALALGTWQALYLWEHRAAPHQRRLVVTITGQ
jgi:secondary thiamine-phosphate synthase enzyme